MKTIDKKLWGKSHISTLFYLVHCFVNKPKQLSLTKKLGTVPDWDYMSINENNYPFITKRMTALWDDKWSTRTNDGERVDGHCEYAIIEELEENGYLKNINTGLLPIFQFSDNTLRIWGQYQALGGDTGIQEEVGAKALAKMVFIDNNVVAVS